MSPSSLARARYLTWPRWIRSNEPDVSTTLYPRPLRWDTVRVISSSEGTRRSAKLTPGLRTPLVTAMLARIDADAADRSGPCRSSVRAGPTINRPMPNYLPFDERRPGTQYRDMLRTIRETGVQVETKQGETALAVAGYQMRFAMAHGAAVITERSIGGFVSK